MVAADNKKSIIIIKRPIVGGGGHHGGSWKVAYADFVTAMMAFFLLMWLLNMSSAEKRKVIQEYFRTFSLLEGGGAFGSASSDALAALDGGKNCDEQTQMFTSKTQEELALIERDVKSSLNRRLTGLEQGLTVHVVGSAVRIELTQQTLFETGGSRLTQVGTRVVAAVGEELAILQRPIEIEGHSDGIQFGNARYSNWDLSVERALAVRRALQEEGVKLEVQRVSGLADQLPLYPGDPGDARNRRITVVIPVVRQPTKPTVLGEEAPPPTDNANALGAGDRRPIGVGRGERSD